MGYKPLDLLVMQPTSFCNLDCTYCYLPNRHIAKRMSYETVDAVFTDLATAPFLGQRLTVVWHAGEPLAAGLPFYFRVVDSSKQLEIRRCHVTHSIQTNATLINDEWCEFFKSHNFRLGVSLDGPSFLHDTARKTRAGKGTHAQVMRGVECLQRHGINFYALCVLTRKSLNHAEDIFEFFTSRGIERLCFNIEEVE
ncbi:MAG: radical SAM protein, partial [Pyrinomonadaceae bacterium]